MNATGLRIAPEQALALMTWPSKGWTPHEDSR